MGSAALKPSAAVGRLLRQKRRERRLTLQEVSDRLGARGDRVPVSTLARIELGKLDPGVLRLHLLLDLFEVPPHLVADLIELEKLAVEPPAETDLEVLFRDGLEHWKQGRISEGLAYLFAVRARVSDDRDERVLRQKATLAFATVARNLGKFRLARQLVDDLLCEAPGSDVLVGALVLAASLWRGSGSTEVALALVRQAGFHTGGPKDEAWVLHQQAKILLEAGRVAEAAKALATALARYRRLGDKYGETQARLLRIAVLEKGGNPAAALDCARRALGWAKRHGHTRLATVALLEQGRLRAGSGKVEAGVKSLRQGLAEATLHGDRAAEFLAHYHLWKVYERLGDADRATFELKTAMHFVQFIDDHSPESDEVRALVKEASRK